MSKTGLAARLLGVCAAFLFSAGGALAGQALPVVKVAIGGAGCLCYLPTVLAGQLGAYKAAGVDVRMINFKGGAPALTAVLGGSADVVSGYYDHNVELVPKGKFLKTFVTYDRFPGLVLVVAPKDTNTVTAVKDLAGKRVGVSAPGSSTDFFLKYLLKKSGVDPNSVPVLGVGLGPTAVAAMEHGEIDAAVMLDPAVTLLKAKYKDLRILSDTRTEQDTLEVFGGYYPGGVLYAEESWVASHQKEAAALAAAIVSTLKWIHRHSAEEIMAKMPPELVGSDKALYLSALRNTIPMYSTDGKLDPRGAEAVLRVFSLSDPEVAKAHIDLSRTYTNRFAEAADARLGIAH